jgi:hypothetical protein
MNSRSTIMYENNSFPFGQPDTFEERREIENLQARVYAVEEIASVARGWKRVTISLVVLGILASTASLTTVQLMVKRSSDPCKDGIVEFHDNAVITSCPHPDQKLVSSVNGSRTVQCLCPR